MATQRIGGLPPRYSFILNKYADVRVSKCPRCDRLTNSQKFALFIHVDDLGPLILGKTCRYCPKCELIVAHQDELEAQLAVGQVRLQPGKSGYFVIGTMDRKAWERGLTGSGVTLADSMKHVAEFKKVFTLKVEGGGWGPA
jgi:predicted Rdx family selenoprotein